VRRWEEAGRPPAPHRPGEGEAIATAPDGRRLRRYGDDIPLPGTTGQVEAMALYAGRSVGAIDDVLPAAEIVRRLAG
jgi:nitronate monooxygenase